MANQTQDYYIQRKAGDPWTVEDFHELQKMVKQDIQTSITTAIDELQEVQKAGDAKMFDGKTPGEYADEIIDRVLAELPKRTGYMMVFKDLKVGEPSAVEHKLGAFPLTDLYQLDYFRVIASEDDHLYETFTSFYLYHSDESSIRFRPEGMTTVQPVSFPIDPKDMEPYRIEFQRMLELYEVQYDDDSSLGDLETEFWKAFFSAPNDRFDDDQYCHSPWFDRCCREMRSVGHLKKRREWDDLFFVVHPSKTINFHPKTTSEADPDDPTMEGSPWTPNNIRVVHFDLNKLGMMLLKIPDLPDEVTEPTASLGSGFPAPDPVKPHLKVMALLKV